MKGLVLSGGEGTRLRPLTFTQAKQLIPVANKPVLFYGLEALSRAGIREIGIVVGDTHREIERAVGDGSRFSANITYIHQEKPLGLAHAVLISELFLEGENFLMYLGDNLLKEELLPFKERFLSEKADALLLLVEVKNPSQFGVAEIRKERVVRLVEKPEDPPSNLALAGVYFFSKKIIEAAKKIKPSWRGELEITDAINELLKGGAKVIFQKTSGWWKDTGKPEDILEANRLVLDDLETDIQGEVVDCSIEGRVKIGKGSLIKKSRILGPAIIGEGVQILNSYIGPYTSIQDGVSLDSVEIENSIVLGNSVIKNIEGRIHSSLIGREAKIIRKGGHPRGLSLILGERSTMEFNG